MSRSVRSHRFGAEIRRTDATPQLDRFVSVLGGSREPVRAVPGSIEPEPTTAHEQTDFLSPFDTMNREIWNRYRELTKEREFFERGRARREAWEASCMEAMANQVDCYEDGE